MQSPVTLAEIEAAATRIAGMIAPTPTVQSASLSEVLGFPVFLKLEHRQTTGAFPGVDTTEVYEFLDRNAPVA